MSCSCRRTQSWGTCSLSGSVRKYHLQDTEYDLHNCMLAPQESENGLSKWSASSTLAHCAVWACLQYGLDNCQRGSRVTSGLSFFWPLASFYALADRDSIRWWWRTPWHGGYNNFTSSRCWLEHTCKHSKPPNFMEPFRPTVTSIEFDIFTDSDSLALLRNYIFAWVYQWQLEFWHSALRVLVWQVPDVFSLTRWYPLICFKKKCSNLGPASVVFSGPSKRGFHGKN